MHSPLPHPSVPIRAVSAVAAVAVSWMLAAFIDLLATGYARDPQAATAVVLPTKLAARC